ncbi:helicase-exonuclease AddAB subunit AddA [Marinilactibacillus sp. 15R]|uniref:helicase-exonuclease AddAB subunit AddA n=1 Tax=Marinilactibacillus sp. 15R TaxID=1911586 RepID=UPI00090CA4A2|nr:helicase-exonuclease AddAB subunit AddA [Marinilactibacillus sp. 15R]API89544.1 helicase-exonuclease AddAB subunit AddA [Marinilactibacillus sp. 15R]
MNRIPEKPKDSLYTESQWRSIHDDGKNLLISASAGSGKTTVLVQRVIEKIKKGIGVDELLVVTYTNAAAREMKERIQRAIQKEINQTKDSALRRHLVQQLPLLNQANISTLHSFCLKVIRRFYYLIDLDPVFRLLTDETENILMKEEVWNDLREKLYGEEDSMFQILAETYSNDRTDDGLTELIFSLYNFSRSNPDPDRWLSDLTKLYTIPDGQLSDSELYKKLAKPQMLQIIDNFIELNGNALSIGYQDSELEKLINILEDESVHFKLIRGYITEDRLEDAFKAIQSFKFKTWSAPRKKTTPDDIKAAASEMKNFRDQAKSAYLRLQEEYFNMSIESQVELIQSVKVLVKEMSRVTKLFSQAFQEHKYERRLLDFNDLEHMTYEILTQKVQGKLVPSEASNYYRDCFKEVMVDEYQDINFLQESILKWLTHDYTEEGNQFMVGDVKQSIYAFRLADPDLFIDKYERYASGIEGERIILAENFRSNAHVLDFTNYIFSQLMDKEVGNLSYDNSARLVQGYKDFPADLQCETEILIYEKETQEETELTEQSDFEDSSETFQIDSKTEGELLMVGEKILELKNNGFEIFDKKLNQTRPIQFGDIVLLTPTKKNNIVIQDVFNKQLDIPTAIKDTQNYFRTTEISIMMSLLNVIDNPWQDIPLAAVLRSPIVGLNEIELTKIRLMNATSSYYESLLEFVEQEEIDPSNRRLQLKLNEFLDMLERWRELARRQAIVKLIWTIYEDTGFLYYVGGMSSGKQRKANLHALYERAASYEKTSFKGLFQFIRFIEKMQKKDKDLAEPSVISSGEDSVRVMTIHASKGLEFPVVFILDMTKKFNQTDLKKSYIFDEKFGVGAEYKEISESADFQNGKFTTLPEKVLKTHKKNKLLSEEMRVLYVALTRAEQKLFLVGSYKDKETALREWGTVTGHNNSVLPADIRLQSSSYMSWIGLALARHHSLDYDSWLTNSNKEITNHPVRFTLSFFNHADLEANLLKLQSKEKTMWYKKFKTKKLQLNEDAQTKQAVVKAVDLINMSYTHQVATMTTSYQSVSEIKRLFEEPNDGQMMKIDVTNPRKPNRYVEDQLERPSFISEVLKPTAPEIGQATHLVLQSLDLSEYPTESSIEKHIENLVKKEVLTKEMAALIRIDQLVRYFKTDFGHKVIKSANQTKREVPFSLILEARELFLDMENEKDHILIHGIVDGYIEEDDGIVLFDYKTDQLSRYKDPAKTMLEKYSGQLRLYRKALESILKRPVKETYLILLDTTEILSIA